MRALRDRDYNLRETFTADLLQMQQRAEA